MPIPNRKLAAPLLLRSWHLLSLDAPTVALVWLFAIAWTARITLPIWIPIVLASGTWGVYLLDRILDARSALLLNQPSQLRLRHIFHWRWRRLLFPLAILLVILAISLAIAEMPATARVRNSFLMAAALSYFFGVHARAAGLATAQFAWLKNFKELFVALIFTAACALPTFARTHNAPALIASALLFVALAWLNCHAIQLWESRASSANNSVLIAAIFLGVIAILTASIATQVDARFTALDVSVALSALLIALLQIYKQQFSPLSLRIAADLALLTPLPLLLWSART
jgi:hypothetical protein